jgi:CubicO group peptidase (beta-lactamase class C family)
MHTNRRKFIKNAGAGVVGLSILPALGGVFGRELAGPFEGLADGSFRFPRASPESQGVSSSAIRQFITAANASGISWHSFMLLRHGNVVAEGWWKPYESQYVHSLYSLSKSFTSTAIGLLVKEGKLDIHAKLVSFFPDDLPAEVGVNLQQVTVRHLLTMNTGHGEDTMPRMRAAAQTSWIRTWLAQPVEFAPGTHFLYNTGNTYMLGAILHKITGETLAQYLAPRLFQPLDITGYDWEVSPQGLNTAGYGLRVRTEDIAKLGQLYLQKGSFNGKTILSPAWVEEATSSQTTSQVNNGDWSEGYGYQFWRCTHGFYRGDGAFGQYCIVMPQYDAVMAVTGQSQDMQQSMNIIWETILPGLRSDALPEDSSSLTALKTDLAALGLPVARGKRGGAGPARMFDMTDNELKIRRLRFEFPEKGVKLIVSTEGKEQVIGFGWEEWVTGETREMYVFRTGDFSPMPTRLAGTATWVDQHTLQLNVRFVEGIFGDKITCVFEGDKVGLTFLNSTSETAKVKTPDPRKGLEGKAV